MPRLVLDGISTHYQQRGVGPDVVLVHAFTSNLSIWFLTPLVEALSKYFRVTAYDLRGHGLTTATATGYDSGALVGDFVRLADALGIGPAFLVGHSYGGVIAMRAAHEVPSRVRGVVLSDVYFPALRQLEPEMGQSQPWRELRETFGTIGIELGEQVDFGRLFRVVAQLQPTQQAKLQQAMGPAGTRWLSQMGQLAGTTAGEEMFLEAGFDQHCLGAVRQPIVALYDEFSPFHATAEYLQSHLADCVTDIVPGARHLAPVQSPVEFTRLVLDHLRRLDRDYPLAIERASHENAAAELPDRPQLND